MTDQVEKKKPSLIIQIGLSLLVLLGGVWLYFRLTAGQKAANQVTSAILRQPIELKNSIETLPASSWKAFEIRTPYIGTLSIEVFVRKGNDIDVFLIPPDQLESIKKQTRFTQLTEFEGQKTRNYRRAARLPAASYVLVLMDKSLGVLSQSSSDIQIRVKIEP